MAQKRYAKVNGSKRVLNQGESQRSDGRFVYRYRQNDKTFSVYARDLDELRKKEKQIESDIADGLSFTDGNKTLRALFDEYAESKKYEWKPATEKNNISMFNNTIATEKIVDMKIYDIKPKHIQELYKRAASRGLRMSSLKFMSYLLGAAFSFAVMNDYIRKDPSAGVLSSMKKLRTTPKIEKTPLTQKQVDSLTAFCKGHPVYDKYLPFLAIAIGTGCRIGELTALQWSDVNRKKSDLSITKSLVYKATTGEGVHFYMSSVKTEKGNRPVDISTCIEAFDAIEKTQKGNGIVCTQPVDGYKNFVFLNRNGKPLSPAQVNNFLNNMQKAYNAFESRTAKIEDREPEFLPHMSAHLLRHTNITLLIERGMSPKAVQGNSGHAQQETTNNFYSHGDTDYPWVKEERKAAGKLVNF